MAITCIALANWKDAKWFDGEREITILRGQFVRSREDFANSCGLSLQKTRTALKHLEKTGFLTRFSTSRYMLFTLPKYGFYQSLANYSDSANPTSNPQLTRPQPAPNPRLTSAQPAPNHKQERQEGEECKEGEECAEPAKTPSAAPPPELSGLTLYEQDSKLCAQWATLLPAWRKAYPGVDVVAEARKAHTWELANPTRIKKNRARFLNTWLSKAQDQPRAPVQPSRTDQNGRTKCLNCGGTGKVAGGVEGGAVKLVDCRRCAI